MSIGFLDYLYTVSELAPKLFENFIIRISMIETPQRKVKIDNSNLPIYFKGSTLLLKWA